MSLADRPELQNLTERDSNIPILLNFSRNSTQKVGRPKPLKLSFALLL